MRMQYKIFKDCEEVYSGYLFPRAQVVPFLDGLVDQKMVTVGDVLETYGTGTNRFVYAGDRVWKSLTTAQDLTHTSPVDKEEQYEKKKNSLKVATTQPSD